MRAEEARAIAEAKRKADADAKTASDERTRVWNETAEERGRADAIKRWPEVLAIIEKRARLGDVSAHIELDRAELRDTVRTRYAKARAKETVDLLKQHGYEDTRVVIDHEAAYYDEHPTYDSGSPWDCSHGERDKYFVVVEW